MEYNSRKQVSESDSDSYDENESYINAPLRKKKRLNLLSTSESDETEDVNLQSINPEDIRWTPQNCGLTIHDFTRQQSGIQIDISYSWKILQFFELFVSEELIDFIVEKTNNQWRRRNNGNPEDVRDTGELYCFIAVCLLMSRNKKLSIDEYWSKNELLRSDIFCKIMSRDRYKQLLKTLHFADDHECNSDRLWKIREIINRLRKSFANAFYPYQNLCIDESMLLFKGRLSFKQFIPAKRSRFGIKSFVLCDCKSGYIQDFIVYNGSNTIHSKYANIGKSGNVVMALLEPYLNKGHTLFVDNWYTSPTLFKLLHMKATNACGTVNKRRKGMPRMMEKLEKGQVCCRYSRNLLAMKWMDKKEVFMLSTMHSDEYVSVPKRSRKEEIVRKPACVHDYNSFMGAVDNTDMVLSTINSTRKSTKWYKKYFMHMIDMCIWNAHCLYKLKTGVTISMAKFHLKLIEQLLEKYQKSTERHSFNTSLNSISTNSARLIERHFPTLYTSEGKNKVRRCAVCSKNNRRRESRYECKECNVGLCICPCFKIFHTVKDY